MKPIILVLIFIINLNAQLSQFIVEKDSLNGYYYYVKKDDCLSKIAGKKEAYNDIFKWPLIYLANRESIKNPRLIYSGQKLFIPKINAPKEVKLEKAPIVIKKRKVETQNKNIENTMNGFVVNETQTKWGADFFEIFYNNFSYSAKEFDYTIYIREKPLMSNQSQIIISVNDNEIFQQQLQPKQDYLEDLAFYSLSVVYSYLDNYEIIQKEMNGDDLDGSGIY